MAGISIRRRIKPTGPRYAVIHVFSWLPVIPPRLSQGCTENILFITMGNHNNPRTMIWNQCHNLNILTRAIIFNPKLNSSSGNKKDPSPVSWTRYPETHTPNFPVQFCTISVCSIKPFAVPGSASNQLIKKEITARNRYMEITRRAKPMVRLTLGSVVFFALFLSEGFLTRFVLGDFFLDLGLSFSLLVFILSVRSVI